MFKTIHTTYGLAKIAAAEATGTPIMLAQMAIGDGNGNPTTPTDGQTTLVREVYRASINRVYQDPDTPNKFTAELLVPATEGGFVIREVGVFDADGGLFAVGNVPDTYKPELSEGAVADTVIRLVFYVTNADVISVTVDPGVAIATQSWVLNAITLCHIAPGGTTGQILRKASNACGDAEWGDLGDLNVVVSSIEETQTLAAAQTQVDWAVATTDGLSVYVEGVRLTQGTGANQWQKAPAPNELTRIILGSTYPSGTKITGVQNEPAGAISNPLAKDENLADVPDKAQARANLDVFSKAEARQLAPAGQVAHFARNTAPSGWLKANGAAVSRTAYADLFAAIGTSFGAGDGFNTFNLPDLRGEFLRAWDDGRGVDAGRSFASWQKGSLQTVDSTQSIFTVTGLYDGQAPESGAASRLGLDPVSPVNYPNARYVGVTGTVATLEAEPNNFGATRPRNIALLACIKF